MKYFFLAFTAIFFAINTLSSQSIEKKWQFQTIENTTGQPLSSVSDSDFFQLENGSFSYQTSAENQEPHTGNYVHQNNVLVLYYNQPKDTIRHFSIKELTDSTLVFSEKEIIYHLKPVPTPTHT
ncbi:lipocalin family protein, partial [Mangrovimonas xylaniphaga]|uniref:lipocalin family protein n=1 Tax=Mangrovimonas xylaniphaga TaxID=1645915 RepID=UPI000A8E6746